MPVTMLTEANWEFAREALGDYAGTTCGATTAPDRRR
jgi:hypothetical protein